MARYIDAEKFLENEIKRCGCVPLVGSCTTDNESLAYQLAKAPTADVVEVRHGEWVKYSTDLYGSNHKCSKCGNLADEDNSGHYAILTNYCSNCGAKMTRTPKERGGEK